MTELRSLEELKEEMLSDPGIAKIYKELEPLYDLIAQVIRARNEQGMTQKDLAGKAGVRKKDVIRFENGEYNPSLKFLERLAEGLGMKLHIEFIPETKKRK